MGTEGGAALKSPSLLAAMESVLNKTGGVGGII